MAFLEERNITSDAAADADGTRPLATTSKAAARDGVSDEDHATHTSSKEAPHPNQPRRLRTGLSRPAWHFIVDSMLFSAFLAMVGASTIVSFVFPKGTTAAGWTLWSLDYDMWANVHFASLAVVLVLTLVHLMLQWRWVCSFVASRLSRLLGRRIVAGETDRTLYGVILLIGVLAALAVLLVVAELNIQPPKTQHLP